MIIPHINHTIAPCAGAGASIVLGFDLHAALGLIGQLVGILSGVVSLAWVAYQFYQATRKR